MHINSLKPLCPCSMDIPMALLAYIPTRRLRIDEGVIRYQLGEGRGLGEINHQNRSGRLILMIAWWWWW